MKSLSSLVSGELSKTSRDSVNSRKLKLSSGDALSEILTLPCPVPRTKSKHKAALNAKAICITDDAVLADLKRKEVEKAEAKEAKRIEKEHKKKIREEKQLETEQRKKAVRAKKQLKKKRTVSNGRTIRSRKNSAQEKGCNDVIAVLHLLSSSSDEDGDSSHGDSGEDNNNSSPEDSGEDNTMCPKCGIRYGDSSEKWICFDG